MIKKRIYITSKNIAYSQRVANSREALNWFREKLERFQIKNPFEPERANVDFRLYDDLLTATYENTTSKKERICLNTLFGVKIFIDPSLKPGQIKFEKGTTPQGRIKQNDRP